MKKIGLILSAWAIFFLTGTGFSAAQQNWSTWLSQVKQEALAEGISPAVIDAAFADVHEPSRQVKGLAHSQPEHRLTYSKYRNSRVDSYRIAIGRKEYKKNQALLEKIGREYGVDPYFIVSFWGMETSYGSYMGNFPVIKSLATLAYDSSRPEFFRKELFIALRILNDGHVSLQKFKGNGRVLQVSLNFYLQAGFAMRLIMMEMVEKTFGSQNQTCLPPLLIT